MIKLLDFYATWCGPCKMLSPIIDELSEDRSLEVVKIDIDKNEDLVKEFGIMSVPTIVLLKDNKEVARNIGFIRKNDLESWISKNI
ncbi:MAG: thioredoxin [Bacillales bacterium]|nr:thioredoxin [Bacillales bacterium]